MFVLRNVTRLLAVVSVIVLGVACESDDDDGDKKKGGFGSLFGGSGSDSGSGSGSGSKGGLGALFSGSNNGGAGGAGAAGGDNGAGGDNSGGGGPVSANDCTAVCTSIIQCIGAACDLPLSAADLQEGVSECVPECSSEASPADLAQIAQLTGNNCAGLNELIEAEGVCGGFGDVNTDIPDFGGAGGEGGAGEGGFGGGFIPDGPDAGAGGAGGFGGGPSGDGCAIACAVNVRCCDPDFEECGDINDCLQVCEFFPAELVSCFVENQNLACDAIESACAF